MADNLKRIVCLLNQTNDSGEQVNFANRNDSASKQSLSTKDTAADSENIANLCLNLSYRDMSSVAVSSINDLNDLNLSLDLSMSLETSRGDKKQLLNKEFQVPLKLAIGERLKQFQPSTTAPTTGGMSEVTVQSSTGRLSHAGDNMLPRNGFCGILSDESESSNIFKLGHSSSFCCPGSSSSGIGGASESNI
ncbi:hypothetical protein BOX15_Mlig027628g1 [Macrostomum lignano]|uniref:Uncharacterized protein n=1 Tax=Macrostomum lignano TaxID=282301 RepID=A0A267GL33_9PLAT|nr:hypothetical protein BOX15_Mlig027628g1 [Macrostomum lignano]